MDNIIYSYMIFYNYNQYVKPKYKTHFVGEKGNCNAHNLQNVYNDYTNWKITAPFHFHY